MRRRKFLVRSLGLLALLGIAAFVFFAVAIAPLANRYVARRICSGVFISGRSPESVWREELSMGDFGYPGRFNWSVDRKKQTVTSKWFWLAGRQAQFRQGLGCTPEGDVDGKLPAALNEKYTLPYKNPFAWPAALGQSAKLAAVLAGAINDEDANTRAVVVIHKGELLAERYADPFTRETPQLGWSMNKSIMHALIGTQVLAGRLALDDDSLFPEWLNDRRREITLRHLLNMSSGLEWNESYKNPFGDAIQMLFGADPVARLPLAKSLVHEPGSRWYYSSGTTNLLALLLRRTLEAADANTLGYPQRALFAPLGMKTAVLEPDHTGTFVASSFGYASALDWARFGQLYLQDGVIDGQRLLPEGWVAQACGKAPAAADGNYGGQFWLKLDAAYTDLESQRKLPSDTCHAVGHEAQFVTIIPSRDVVIVRMGLMQKPGAWDHGGFVLEVLDALP